MKSGILHLGIDPGVKGAIGVIYPDGRPDIIRCPESLDLMASLIIDLIIYCEANQTRITLEKVGSFGMEGRATLTTFMVNFGQWQGILATVCATIEGVSWQLVTPQAWQKPYRERLIPGPKKPKREHYNSKTTYKVDFKKWKSDSGKAQRARKKELVVIAAEAMPNVVSVGRLKLLTQDTADAYLIALHGKDHLEWTSKK